MIVSLLCISVLIAGCGRTNKNYEENGTADIRVVGQNEADYLSLPENIAELEDSERQEEYAQAIVKYDVTQFDYQIMKRIDSLGYTAQDFTHSGEDCFALYQDILAGRGILLNTNQITISTPIRLVQDTYLMGLVVVWFQKMWRMYWLLAGIRKRGLLRRIVLQIILQVVYMY